MEGGNGGTPITLQKREREKEREQSKAPETHSLEVDQEELFGSRIRGDSIEHAPRKEPSKQNRHFREGKRGAVEWGAASRCLKFIQWQPGYDSSLASIMANIFYWFRRRRLKIPPFPHRGGKRGTRYLLPGVRLRVRLRGKGAKCRLETRGCGVSAAGALFSRTVANPRPSRPYSTPRRIAL